MEVKEQMRNELVKANMALYMGRIDELKARLQKSQELADFIGKPAEQLKL